MADRFPSPFDMTAPTGAEGWEQLYGYSTVFSEDRREYEDSMFWFMDGVHTPEVIPPWDATVLDFAIIVLSQYNTRHYVIPPALGVDIRYLNGYMYLSPVGVADPEEIEARVPEFAERAGYYFGNWDALYDAWLPKVKDVIREIEAIDFQPLPHREDMAVLTEGRGMGSGSLMLEQYDKLVQLTIRLWNHHFEFLNLGYAAYLDFFGFCKQLFPSIPDQAIAKMVAGIEVDLFRPDEELKKLARLAVELGVADRISNSAADTLEKMGTDEAGTHLDAVVGAVARPVVQLLPGQRLLQLGPGVEGLPGHPDELHRELRRRARPRRVARTPDRGDREGARPDRR